MALQQQGMDTEQMHILDIFGNGNSAEFLEGILPANHIHVPDWDVYTPYPDIPNSLPETFISVTYSLGTPIAREILAGGKHTAPAAMIIAGFNAYGVGKPWYLMDPLIALTAGRLATTARGGASFRNLVREFWWACALDTPLQPSDALRLFDRNRLAPLQNNIEALFPDASFNDGLQHIADCLDAHKCQKGFELLLKKTIESAWPEIPKIVLAGEHDVVVPPAMVQGSFPDAELAIVEAATHALPYTHAEACAARLQNVFDVIDKSNHNKIYHR